MAVLSSFFAMLSPYMLKVSTRGSMIRKMSDKADALAEKYGADAVHNFSLGNPRIPPPPEYYKALIEVANEEIPLCYSSKEKHYHEYEHVLKNSYSLKYLVLK